MVQDFEKNLNPFVSVSTLLAPIDQLDNLPSKKKIICITLFIVWDKWEYEEEFNFIS